MFGGTRLTAAQVKASHDYYYGPSACTAHVDPLADQQARVARQMQAEKNAVAGTMPPHVLCYDCSASVRRKDADWILGGWFCQTCAANQPVSAPANAQAANASLPCASCGSWLKPNNGVMVGGKLYHAGCAPTQAQQSQKPASAMPPWGNWPNIVPPDLGPFVSPPDHKPGGPGALGSPDFGAQVSDQLAQQRGIDRAAANDAMRVPTFEEQEAERARMADYFRKCGVL